MGAHDMGGRGVSAGHRCAAVDITGLTLRTELPQLCRKLGSWKVDAAVRLPASD